MPDLIPVGFLGLGTFVPQRVLTNHDLEQMVETSDEWIVTRTGIRERHICADDECTSDMATAAARAAIADAGLTPDQIDLIICGTYTPDHLTPSTACIVQANLGVTRPIPAFDLSAACSGFVYALSVGVNFVQTGMYRHVLVVGADAMSKVLDNQDRNTCVLFGDGAGAVVLGRVEPGRGLIGHTIGADGRGAEQIIMHAGGSREPFSLDALNNRRQYMRMAGREVYKFATSIVAPAIEDALRNGGNGLCVQDLELIIPHQANMRIIEAAAKKLGLPIDRFVVNIDRYGNTSGATVPLAMGDARAAGRLQPGTLFALVAFGGGLTYGASIWRW